jgi:KRAB domain-containing zinc finger protein
MDIFTKHKLTHNAKKMNHMCDLCGKGFSNAMYLSAHMRRHGDDKPFKCDECGKCFVVNHELKRHMRTHSDRKPYTCEQCGIGFLQISALNLHVRSFHGDKCHACEHCDKAFSHMYQLEIHMRSHTGENPYHCLECGKLFRFKSSLKKHTKKKHSGTEPIKCNDCEACFDKKSELKRHVTQTHSTNSFICVHCDKHFCKKSNLEMHMKFHHVHSVETDSNSADKRFSKEDPIQEHTQDHDSKKTYQCGFCDEEFSHMAGLNNHTRTHTQDDCHVQDNTSPPDVLESCVVDLPTNDLEFLILNCLDDIPPGEWEIVLTS